MNPWASRRKSLYMWSMVLLLTLVGFWIFWKFWYSVPNCFDGYRNGDESGVDCGGSCSLVCSGDTIKPIVRWDPRLFEVTPNTWSALVYVENPNTGVDAIYAPYSFIIYGDNNKILVERKGATFLPKNKTVGVFEGSIVIEDGERPKRAVFELGNDIVWNKNQKMKDDLTITHSPILREETAPRVEASVRNNGIEEIKNIELVIAIFDGRENAVAASRTFIENLKKGENANIFFTWPKPFELGSRMCERPVDTVLLLDRSGSMSSISTNPPEPLSSAKAAAISFVKQLGSNAKVSLVSFATESKEPIDLNLTSDFALAEKIIEAVSIEKENTQYTNIYGAIHSARQELLSSRSEAASSKIAILLTDGVATKPADPEGRTEAEDIKYAESLALKESADAKKDGLLLYTIGLGDKINESFLKQIASSPENYFNAPSTTTLMSIYQNISSSICKEVPVRIEITYKIFDSNY